MFNVFEKKKHKTNYCQLYFFSYLASRKLLLNHCKPPLLFFPHKNHYSQYRLHNIGCQSRYSSYRWVFVFISEIHFFVPLGMYSHLQLSLKKNKLRNVFI